MLIFIINIMDSGSTAKYKIKKRVDKRKKWWEYSAPSLYKVTFQILFLDISADFEVCSWLKTQ